MKKSKQNEKIVEKSGKKRKKVKKSEKSEKIALNFASLRFASKQKWLNRSEAKNVKRKKAKISEIMRKNSEKMRKIAKKSEKSEKIHLNIASLCFTSKQKWLKWSETKNLKRK